ncbi:MAG: hypothetical protein BMS9Abin01_0198 [Gammaproteobacteria bacterium]|nr:MAG: hypothetical protein BMS9Abin01_0198 [Gammaproteobacteria bacterium]
MATQASGDTGLASQSVTLEVIVKFTDDSEPGRRVDRILKEHPADLSGLADLQARLHRSTGVVLEPERITSGGELIFRIPEEPLLEIVKQTVTRRAQVSSAKLVAIQHGNPRLPESLLLLHFRESSQETELLEKAYGAPTVYRERVQVLATELSGPSGVPVRGTAEAESALAVTVDRHTLLQKLVAQLSGLAYVDYAQPNSTVQFMK